MRKPELIDAIAQQADISKARAGEILNILLDQIALAVAHQPVTLVGFGTFEKRSRSARTGKNPQTGEPLKIAASHTVAFRPGKGLKQAVNQS